MNWSRTQDTTKSNKNKTGYSASDLNNNNKNKENMSKEEKGEEKKAPKKLVKKAAKKEAPAKKAPVKAAKKGPGVIASILEFITDKPITESQILEKLVKRFPERTGDAMTKTIRIQIGSKARPTRMEKERNVSFLIGEKEVKGKKVKTFALAKK